MIDTRNSENRIEDGYAPCVMKFGGSSLAGPDEFLQCKSIIQEHIQTKSNSLVVVCSAMGDTTDHILKAIDLAEEGKFEDAKAVLSEIRKVHFSTINKTITTPLLFKETCEFLDRKLDKLEKMLYGISLVRDTSSRTTDFILSFGEQLSTLTMANLLSSYEFKAEYLTGGQAGIVTDDNFGSAEPIHRMTEENLRKKILPLLSAGVIPIVTGFIASTFRTNEMITLGRGGSDYTASLIATAIGAKEVILWTDVDGIMTADPRLVKDARIVEQITYLEAMEMSAFGAKAMQPRALEPVARNEIPVRIKNTFNPKSEGTLIVGISMIGNGERDQNTGVKCIGSLSDVAIVTISGARIVGQPGTALAIFDILKELQVSLLMISQSVSESNVSIIIKKDKLTAVVHTLRERLLHEEEADEEYSEKLNSVMTTPPIRNYQKKRGSVFARVDYEDDVSVIGVLGRGMIGTPGVAGRVFAAVANQGINIRMIAQGSSEINISFVVKAKDRTRAVIALHDEFRLGEFSSSKISKDEGSLKFVNTARKNLAS
jgi:aspartate kinase